MKKHKPAMPPGKGSKVKMAAARGGMPPPKKGQGGKVRGKPDRDYEDQ